MKSLYSFLFMIILAMPFRLTGQEVSQDNKYPDSINRKDDSGNKTGYWIEKANDVTYKGEYVANKKNNNWVGYYSNNVVSKVEYYSNGVKDGISVQLDRKGKITLLEHYKNGMLHGQVIAYSSMTEIPVSEAMYANGKKNGMYRQFYDNGKIQEETWFKNDMKDGVSKWNNKNGQRLAEYNYKANNFDGVQTTFYENDTVQTINTYKDNKLSGESKEFYRNGKIKASGKYVNGLKEGAWTEYNELGKIEKVTRYKEGEEIIKK
jgi:uncharacterized protein